MLSKEKLRRNQVEVSMNFWLYNIKIKISNDKHKKLLFQGKKVFKNIKLGIPKYMCESKISH